MEKLEKKVKDMMEWLGVNALAQKSAGCPDVENYYLQYGPVFREVCKRAGIDPFME